MGQLQLQQPQPRQLHRDRRAANQFPRQWAQAGVEHGDAAKAILELAERVEADLIVLGARKATFWLTHVVHGLTPDLLAQATCPVMTVC